MINALWIRTLTALERAKHEERGDSLVNWIVLAVGLAAAAAVVVAVLRPAISTAAQSIASFISGG